MWLSVRVYEHEAVLEIPAPWTHPSGLSVGSVGLVAVFRWYQPAEVHRFLRHRRGIPASSSPCHTADQKFAYQTSTVKRFGEYVVNLSRPPEPWIKEVVVQFKPSKPQPASWPPVKEA